MKFKTFSITALVIALLMTGYFIVMVTSMHGTVGSGSSNSVGRPLSGDTAFGGIFSSPEVNYSMSYSEYMMIINQFKQKRQAQDVQNKGSNMEGFSIGCMGIYSGVKFNANKDSLKILNTQAFLKTIDSLSIIRNDEKDSVKIIARDQQINRLMQRYNNNQVQHVSMFSTPDDTDRLYYFALNNYTLDNYDTRFYIDNGTYHLAVVKIDTVINKGLSNEISRGHYESKQIKVRYSESRKAILIPVSKKMYSYTRIIIITILLLLMLLSVYCFIGLPIRILYNISRGNAFTLTTIRQLKTVRNAAVIITLMTIILPYLLHFIFHNQIPNEIRPSRPLDILSDNFRMIAFAVILFFISKAFTKGYQLQQENDLTV